MSMPHIAAQRSLAAVWLARCVWAALLVVVWLWHDELVAYAGNGGASMVLQVLVFSAVYILLVGVAMPGVVVLSVVAGSLFGIWLGTIVASCASTAGACVAFLASRYLLQTRRTEGRLRGHKLKWNIHQMRLGSWGAPLPEAGSAGALLCFESLGWAVYANTAEVLAGQPTGHDTGDDSAGGLGSRTSTFRRRLDNRPERDSMAACRFSTAYLPGPDSLAPMCTWPRSDRRRNQGASNCTEPATRLRRSIKGGYGRRGPVLAGAFHPARRSVAARQTTLSQNRRLGDSILFILRADDYLSNAARNV